MEARTGSRSGSALGRRCTLGATVAIVCAALAFGRFERNHHALGKIAVGRFKGRFHRFADGRLPHQVGLHREAVTLEVAVLDDRHVARLELDLGVCEQERRPPGTVTSQSLRKAVRVPFGASH